MLEKRMNTLAMFHANLAADPNVAPAMKLPRWRVDIDAGTVNWADVSASTLTEAIEQALTQMDDGEGWPWSATEMRINVRRLDK